MKDIMIKVDNVVYEYKSYIEDKMVAAVKNLSLEVRKGEFLVVLGHNGSGKSTWLR